MFSNSMEKAKELATEKLRQAGINEHDIGIVLERIEKLEKAQEKLQKEFEEEWNKWGHKRKGKPKLSKEG